MKSTKHTIVFTGGGSAGHVTPNFPIIESFIEKKWRVFYIGSEKGIEKSLLTQKNIPYISIKSGKLRRYFSFKNATDVIRIFIGILQALKALRIIKPNIIFSKGGFVSFPVVFAAWLLRIPVIAHESDLTPGLSNRLCYPFVKKLAVTFPEACNHFKSSSKKVEVTGTPIRDELLKGNKSNLVNHCPGFDMRKPVILIIGGSLGADRLNAVVRNSLDSLLSHFQIIHLCGKGKLVHFPTDMTGYFQFEYVNHEMADFYDAASLIISRAGANSVYEILTLNKPHIFVPLSKKASRGDQIENAYFFHKKGVSSIIEEAGLNEKVLIHTIDKVLKNKNDLIEKMAQLNIKSGTDTIVDLIIKTALNKE